MVRRRNLHTKLQRKNLVSMALPKRVDPFRRLLLKEDNMRTDGMVYASDELWEDLEGDESLQQVRNVATLPGIVGRSLAMPDIHWGYGFPIGGVAAFDLDTGVISPGGVGFDINCGVRLLQTELTREEVTPQLDRLADSLYGLIPSGIGGHRSDIRFSKSDLEEVMSQGASYLADRGFGEAKDIEHLEAGGVLSQAEPDRVSKKATERGHSQLGTIGSGNHFVEVGAVEEIYDEVAAAAFGLRKGQITVIIHTGSRGLGYQVCDDNLKSMVRAAKKHGIHLPDQQLAAVPFMSDEGKAYFAQMCAAANFAFANRQLITHWVRESFFRVFKKKIDIGVVYDVCHNIAKVEEHTIDGVLKNVCVHRKGATRAFPAGHKDVPEDYRAVGQPVMVPGDMGRCSYVMVGTDQALKETFGSCCHGAGRVLSRQAAKKRAKGRNIIEELLSKGIHVRAQSMGTVIEEMPDAYKDVSQVIEAMAGAGLANKVAKLVPLAVVKG
jgi:tRNA-splicing ligase RtcB (3'-phosphate/5'-hydroxy nucleic acid ligase)